MGEADTRKAEAYPQVSTNPEAGRCVHRETPHRDGAGGKTRKDTNKRLNEGKTGPRERERNRRNHPSPTEAWVPPQPAPLPASCTQVVRDDQRALEGLESIAHQVNKVLHDTEQVHRARGHLGTKSV